MNEKNESNFDGELAPDFTKNPKFRWALRLIILGGLLLVGGIAFVLFTVIMRLGSSQPEKQVADIYTEIPVMDAQIDLSQLDIIPKQGEMNIINVSGDFVFLEVKKNNITHLYQVNIRSGEIHKVVDFLY